jgi:hypothetical protein
MAQHSLDDLDLVELSDLAWGFLDADGSHEAEEQAWVALLGAGWPPIATVAQLRAHLDAIAGALVAPSPAVPLGAVAALMAFLAAHPERRGVDEGLFGEALREAFPGGELPGDITAWLAARAKQPASHRRRHGAHPPRRRFHARPARPESPAG